jgi:hypothetical protein
VSEDEIHPGMAAILAALVPSRVPGSGAPAVEWRVLEAIAREHRVLSMVAQAAIRGRLAGAPGDIARMRAYRRAATLRALQMQRGLAILARSCAQAGIPLLVLKGMALAFTAYEQPADREMIDIDLLVPQERLAEVEAIVKPLGYSAAHDEDRPATMALDNHLPRLGGDGFSLELHWRLEQPRHGLSIDLADLWTRAVPVPVMNRVLVMPAEDQLLHVCLHAATLHLFDQGLRPLLDVRALVTRHGASLSWETVATRARAWGVTRSVQLVLEMANAVVAAGVPAAALAEFRSPPPDAAVVAAATRLVLMPDPRAHPLEPSIGRWMGLQSWPARLRLLWSRVWLPEVELATVYPLEAGRSATWRVYLRGRRVLDLLRRHGPRLMHASLPAGSASRTLIIRRNLVTSWLQTGAGVPEL